MFEISKLQATLGQSLMLKSLYIAVLPPTGTVMELHVDWQDFNTELEEPDAK